MPLLATEIKPSAIAYFDAAILIADPLIVRPQIPLRTGPFVCLQVDSGRSTWTPLTTQFRQERLPIEAQWRLEGSIKWQSEDLYLNDGANTCIGPNSSFVVAAAGETPFTKIKRPQLAAAGITAIIAEVQSRHGMLL